MPGAAGLYTHGSVRLVQKRRKEAVMENLFKIGEVASLFDVSIRTLRLYNKIGLLKPEVVDPKSRYRYYTDGQITRLRAILGLRRVGFTLDQVRIMLDGQLSQPQLSHMLAQKKAENQRQIDCLRYNNELIGKMMELSAGAKGASAMDTLDEEAYALTLSRIFTLENPKLETVLHEALWL